MTKTYWRCSQKIWIYFRGIVKMEWFIKIPNAILQDKDLNHTQMLLYGYILSLSTKKWYCYATNKILWDYLNITKSRVSNHLTTLKEHGYLEIEDWQLRKITPIAKNSKGVANIGKGGCQKQQPDIYNIINKEYISKDIYKKDEMFELFWKQYPHYRQWKKQDSKNFFLKQDPAKVMKQVVIYKRQTLSWIKDKKYVPACQRWIRDFTELSDDVIQQDLKQIVKRHLNTEWDKHERYEKLKQDFPDVNFNEIAKEISREKWLIKMTFT